MKITSVTIENWRNIHHLTLDFDSRITILHGPNETGKSTVQEAIRHALLAEATSTAVELKELVPWGSSAKAHVTLSFETKAGDRIRIEKSFPKGEARLYRVTRTGEALLAEGRGVQAAIFEYLGIPSEARDLFSLLWIGQGTSLALFGRKPGDGPIQGPAQTLIKSIIKENLLSARVEGFYQELVKERDGIMLKSGRPKKGSRLGELEGRKTDLERELSLVESELREAEGRAGELAKMERELAELGERRRQEEGRLALLEKKHERTMKLEPALQRYRELEDRRKRLLEIEVKAREALQSIPRLAEAKRGLIAAWLAGLEDRQARVGKLRGSLDEIARQLADLHVSDRKSLDLIEESSQAVREAQLRLDASQLTVKATSSSPSGSSFALSVDEGPEEEVALEGSREWKAARSAKLSVGDGLTVECSGPLSHAEWGALVEEIARETSRLAERLSALGCRDLAEAKEQFDAYLHLKEEESRLEADLASLLGPGGSSLEEELESARQAEIELSRENRAAGDLGVSLPPVGEAQPAAATGPKGGARSEGAGTPPTHRGEESVTERIRRVSSELSVTLRDLGESREQREAILAGQQREDLSRDLLSLKEEIDYEESVIAGMEPREVESVTLGDLKEIRMGVERIAEELASAGREQSALNALQGKSTGLIERKEAAERDLASVERELAGEQRRLGAIELLVRLMEEEKVELDRNIIGPVRERLSEAFSKVVGDSYGGIEVGDNLDVGRIEVPALGDGVYADVGALSYGTREQLSFLFRLLLAQYLSSREPQVMMLDDTFVNTDSTRRDRLFEMITGDRNNLQFILFTCHGEHYEAYQGRDGVAMIDITHGPA